MANVPAAIYPMLWTNEESAFSSVPLTVANVWPEPAPEGSQAPFIYKNIPGIESRSRTAFSMSGAPEKIVHAWGQDGIFNSRPYYFLETQGVYEAVGAGSLLAGSAGIPMSNVRAAGIEGFMGFSTGLPGALYFFDGASVSIDINGFLASDIAALADRFFWIDGTDDTVRYTNLGTGNSSPLNFFTAETFSDRLNGVHEHSEYLYLGGVKSTEIWRISPDSDLPVAYSTSIPHGMLGPNAKADAGGLMAFVGGATDGYQIYLGSGASFKPIAPNWLCRLIGRIEKQRQSGVGNITSTVHMNAFESEGHLIFEVHVPGFDGTGSGLGIIPAQTFHYSVQLKAWVEYNDTASLATTSDASRAIVQTSRGIDVARRSGTLVGGAGGDTGEFSRKTNLIFGIEPDYEWAYWQAVPRRQQVNELVMQFQTNRIDASTLGGGGAVVDLATVGGALSFNISDNQGMNNRYAPNRALTTYTEPDAFGSRCNARRLGEVRQPGRLYRFLLESLNSANFQVGPLLLDVETLNG